MPYRKWFIGDAPADSDDAFLTPIPDEYPDPGISGIAMPLTLGALIIVEGTEARAKAMLLKHRDEIVQHPGGVGFLRSDGRLTWGKIVPARVDEDAVLDWFVNARDKHLMTRAAGYATYPDRPPDVDTPTQRAWVMHPDRPDDFGSVAVPIGKLLEALRSDGSSLPTVPIYTAVVRQTEFLDAKLVVTWHRRDSLNWPEGQEGDGAYEVRFKLETPNSVRLDKSRMFVDPTVMWEATEEILSKMCEMADPDAAPLITGPDETVLDSESWDQVQRDVLAYYAEETARKGADALLAVATPLDADEEDRPRYMN